MMRISQEETMLSMKYYFPPEIEVLKRILISEDGTLFSIVSFAMRIQRFASKHKMHEAPRNSWTVSVVATMRCLCVASRVADPTINIMRQKT